MENQTVTIQSALANKAYSEVSEKYQYLSTISIVKALEQSGWKLKKQDEARLRGKANKRQGYQKHILIFENENFVNAEGKIQLVIKNAHDRSGSLEIFLGFMRIVCANQLFAKNMGDGMHFRIRHSAKGLEQLKNAISMISGNANRITDNINFLKAKELTNDQVKIFTNQAIELRFGDNAKQLQLIDQTILHEPKREEDRGQNAWVVFQRIQEQFTQGGLHYTDGKKMRTVRKLKSINVLPDFNSKLWELAVQI